MVHESTEFEKQRPSIYLSAKANLYLFEFLKMDALAVTFDHVIGPSDVNEVSAL